MATREKPEQIFWFDLETTGLGEAGGAVLPYHLAGILTDTNLNEIDRIEMFFEVPGSFQWEPVALKMATDRRLKFVHPEPSLWERLSGRTPKPLYAAVDGVPTVSFEAGMSLLTTWLHGRRTRSSISPAGQNIAAYDLPILRKLWHSVNETTGGSLTLLGGWPFDYHPIDTYVYAGFDFWFANNEVTSVSLVRMCKHLGIPLTEANAHNAMNDVLATLELGRALVARCRNRSAG